MLRSQSNRIASPLSPIRRRRKNLRHSRSLWFCQRDRAVHHFHGPPSRVFELRLFLRNPCTSGIGGISPGPRTAGNSHSTMGDHAFRPRSASGLLLGRPWLQTLALGRARHPCDATFCSLKVCSLPSRSFIIIAPCFGKLLAFLKNRAIIHHWNFFICIIVTLFSFRHFRGSSQSTNSPL